MTTFKSVLCQEVFLTNKNGKEECYPQLATIKLSSIFETLQSQLAQGVVKVCLCQQITDQSALFKFLCDTPSFQVDGLISTLCAANISFYNTLLWDSMEQKQAIFFLGFFDLNINSIFLVPDARSSAANLTELMNIYQSKIIQYFCLPCLYYGREKILLEKNLMQNHITTCHSFYQLPTSSVTDFLSRATENISQQIFTNVCHYIDSFPFKSERFSYTKHVHCEPAILTIDQPQLRTISPYEPEHVPNKYPLQRVVLDETANHPQYVISADLNFDDMSQVGTHYLQNIEYDNHEQMINNQQAITTQDANMLAKLMSENPPVRETLSPAANGSENFDEFLRINNSPKQRSIDFNNSPKSQGQGKNLKVAYNSIRSNELTINATNTNENADDSSDNSDNESNSSNSNQDEVTSESEVSDHHHVEPPIPKNNDCSTSYDMSHRQYPSNGIWKNNIPRDVHTKRHRGANSANVESNHVPTKQHESYAAGTSRSIRKLPKPKYIIGFKNMQDYFQHVENFQGDVNNQTPICNCLEYCRIDCIDLAQPEITLLNEPFNSFIANKKKTQQAYYYNVICKGCKGSLRGGNFLNLITTFMRNCKCMVENYCATCIREALKVYMNSGNEKIFQMIKCGKHSQNYPDVLEYICWYDPINKLYCRTCKIDLRGTTKDFHCFKDCINSAHVVLYNPKNNSRRNIPDLVNKSYMACEWHCLDAKVNVKSYNLDKFKSPAFVQFNRLKSCQVNKVRDKVSREIYKLTKNGKKCLKKQTPPA